MTIKNRYIYVGSSFESELVQTLLFEAGAGWTHIGQSLSLASNCHIVINENLEMSLRDSAPSDYKELSLLELAITNTGETSMETETLHICEVVDNHVRFQDSEVNLNPDELYVLLHVIRSLPNRDFEITTRDDDGLEDGELFPMTNLTINFK